MREILPPFFVSLLAFLVFISLELIFSLSDAVFARGISTAVLLRLLSYKLPYILTLAAPAGTLLATFLALARLASDRELLAFQALGYSLRRLLFPFIVFGLLVSLASFAFSEFCVPAAEAQYRRELLTILYRGPAPLIQKNVFFRGPRGELFYVERYSGDKVEGVVVYDLAGQLYPHSSFPAVVTAKEGKISAGHVLLRHGRIMHFGSRGELTEVLSFQELNFEVGEHLEEAILGSRTPSEMSIRELGREIEQLRKIGHDVRRLLVEYHGKLAVAAAALVFVLFGAPLGAILGHRGRATGMIVGFLLAAGAQGLFLLARTLARQDYLPPFLGGWLPHLVFGTLGLLLFFSSDRLRLRGLALFLFLGITGLATPPFQELSAEELVVEANGKSFQAVNAKLILGEYILTAPRLSLSEEGEWILKAEDVEVRAKENTVRARHLSAWLSSAGGLTSAKLQTFSGEVKFSGPEKEETLIFFAEEGEVKFAEGKLIQVEGKKVTFTTCPCIDGAPYLVRAEEFLLFPGRWLFVRNLRVDSFGYPVVWVPFYAARLGEEGMPFLPEVGHAGLGWFLRWSIPWSLGEGMVGTFLLTWYPQAGRLDPGLQAVWENGGLALSPERALFRVQGKLFGEAWQTKGRLDKQGLVFSLSGRIQGWELAIQAGLVEEETVTYTRIPEITFSRNTLIWGNNLGLRLGFGRYREKDVEGWRAGLAGSWGWSREFWSWTFHLPLNFGLDQYPGTERVYFAVNPNLSFGGLSLWYQAQLGVGRSLFAFDATPTQSQAGFSVRAGEQGWSHSLTLGWDFLAQAPLPGRWVVSGPGFSLDLSFQLLPLRLSRARWKVFVKHENFVLHASGGHSGLAWDDILVRARIEEKSWSLEGGLRLRLPDFLPRRLAASAQGTISPEWGWAVSGEFDFLTMKFVQLEASFFYTFSGCLRLGLVFYLSGFRLSLDVPAFPEAKIRFAPLDEGLRLGGL